MTDWLSDRLEAFLREHSGMSVDLDELPNQESAEVSRSGACYIGVVAHSTTISP